MNMSLPMIEMFLWGIFGFVAVSGIFWGFRRAFWSAVKKFWEIEKEVHEQD